MTDETTGVQITTFDPNDWLAMAEPPRQPSTDPHELPTAEELVTEAAQRFIESEMGGGDAFERAFRPRCSE